LLLVVKTAGGIGELIIPICLLGGIGLIRCFIIIVFERSYNTPLNCLVLITPFSLAKLCLMRLVNYLFAFKID